jgi:type I restriction enzyme S subunit
MKMSKLDQLIADLCPGGVEFVQLGEIAIITRGVRLIKSQLAGNGKCPVYQNSMIPLGYYEESNCPANTVFVISAGAAGEIGYSTVDFWAADDCFYFACSERLQSRYLYYALLCQQSYIFSRVRRASVPRLARSVVGQLAIPLPPLSIQQETVRILDTFTALQAELQARKRQYEYYRDCLLQNEEFERKPLGDIGEFFRGRRFTKADYADIGISCIHYGEIYTHYGVSAKKVLSYVRPDMKTKLRFAEPGDVVITDVGETVEDVGKAVAWLGKEKVAIHDHCYAFRHTMNAEFISYCMQTNSYKAEKYKHVAQTKVNTLLINGVSKVQIPVPPLEEQARIVEILNKFNTLTNDLTSGLPAEIAARRKQYEYYRDKLLNFNKKNIVGRK